MFGKFQDIIKECILKLINTNNTKFNSLRSGTREFNFKHEQNSAIETEFKDRSERIKVNNIYLYLRNWPILSMINQERNYQLRD